MDKNLRSYSKAIKSISLTRSSNLTYYSDKRIVFDTDKLIRGGYVPEPFDEFSTAANRKKKTGHI